MQQLQKTRRRATLLRLLRALKHFETVGVVHGELPPCGDYFGRVLTASEQRSRDSLQLKQVIQIDDSDDEAAAARRFTAIDVEEYLILHKAELWGEASASSSAAIVKSEAGTEAQGATPAGAQTRACSVRAVPTAFPQCNCAVSLFG